MRRYARYKETSNKCYKINNSLIYKNKVWITLIKIFNKIFIRNGTLFKNIEKVLYFLKFFIYMDILKYFKISKISHSNNF